jgi:hypothetical protein
VVLVAALVGCGSTTSSGPDDVPTVDARPGDAGAADGVPRILNQGDSSSGIVDGASLASDSATSDDQLAEADVRVQNPEVQLTADSLSASDFRGDGGKGAEALALGDASATPDSSSRADVDASPLSDLTDASKQTDGHWTPDTLPDPDAWLVRDLAGAPDLPAPPSPPDGPAPPDLPAVTHVTVAIVGDTAEKGRTSITRSIVEMVERNSPPIDSLFIAGDCVRYDGSGTLLNFFKSYWVPASESNLAHLDGIVFPQLGNHEYLETNAQGYFDYFKTRLATIAELPSYHGSIDSIGKGWYSVDVNQWHVVSLNANCSNVSGGCGASGSQGKWLAADLADHAGMPTVAIWHEPLWTCTLDGHDAEDRMQPLRNMLYDAHADFVFNGHNHVYQRYRPLDKRAPAGEDQAGITEIIVGTGGSTSYQVCPPSQDPRVAKALGGDEALGSLFFTFGSDGSYDWQFRLQSDDSVFDSGQGRSHNAR